MNADERDALIEVDGKTQGFTPSVLQVPAGKHTVRVTLRGFKPVVREVDVKINEQTQLDLVLLTADSVEAASRVAEPIEDAPASVTLIPSPELRAMRYPNVAEAVRGVRGVYVSEDRSYKNVGFRGFSRPGDYGNRVLVLVDGHPTNDNWLWSSYVGYDLRTDLEDIERIEVVRGPGSVLYGTGAFSGVINLVTNGQDAPDGREIGLSVADEGVARARARVTYHFDKDAGVWTSIAAGRSAGNDYFFREYASDGPPSVAGNARDVDGFRMATWQGRFFYKAFSVQWSGHTHEKGIPTGEYETNLGDARAKQADSRAFVEAKLEPKIGDSVVLTTRAHVNYYAYRGKFPRSPGAGGLERNDYDGGWVGAEQRAVFAPLPELRITGGGEVQYHGLAHQRTENETQGRFFDDSRTFTLAAGYAMIDAMPMKELKASAAARFDSYSTSGSSLNPRLAIVAKPYDGGNVKVIAGKAFRAPSIYELFYVAGGGQTASPGLDPENLYSAEIEYSHKFSRSVTATVSTYANYITDLIALRSLPGASITEAAYAYQNTREPVGTLGAEAELRREWKEGWMVGASYAFQETRYLKSRSIGDLFSLSRAPGFRDVPNAPNHLGSVRGGVPILGRALLLMNRVTFEGPRADRNDEDVPGAPPQGRTPPVFLWDVVLSGTEQRWGLSYSFGVYNAFDTRWSVPASAEFRQTTVAQNGRTFLALGSVVF
ncbi:MAG: TonB-dependent receptor [Rubrivivax sp.]